MVVVVVVGRAYVSRGLNMVLELIQQSLDNDWALMFNGFAIVKDTKNGCIIAKEQLERLTKLHRVSCHEEHGLNKITGAPESDLRITFHIHKA